MSNLIATMARFSTAMTLFGVEQLEKTMNVVGGGAELNTTVEELEQTLNALTEVLTGKMDEKKKETLSSVTKMTEETIGRTMDSMEVLDPRELVKTSSGLLQKTTEATSEWVSKAAATVEKAAAAARSDDAAAGNSR